MAMGCSMSLRTGATTFGIGEGWKMKRLLHSVSAETGRYLSFLLCRFDVLRVCKQSISGFTRSSFLEHACLTYLDVNNALNQGNPLLVERCREVRLDEIWWLRGSQAPGSH